MLFQKSYTHIENGESKTGFTAYMCTSCNASFVMVDICTIRSPHTKNNIKTDKRITSGKKVATHANKYTTEGKRYDQRMRPKDTFEQLVLSVTERTTKKKKKTGSGKDIKGNFSTLSSSITCERVS